MFAVDVWISDGAVNGGKRYDVHIDCSVGKDR